MEFETVCLIVKTIEAALRKQIPLDYKISEDGDALCPICGADAEWHKYCEECGQALKWKDESD